MTQLHRILVATDFSPAGKRAVTRAGELAREHGATLHLVHATPDWNLFSRWASAQQEHYGQVTSHSEVELRHELTRIQGTFGVITQGEVQKGKASEVISRVIRSFEPDIVIVGARGEHEPRIAPAALGGTALKLFFQAQCPLLLVRENEAPPYRTSMAAVNEATDLSKNVILWATTLVPNGDCHIVHAYDALYSERMRLCGLQDTAIEACIRDTESRARESLDKLIGAAAAGTSMHIHLERGNPLGILVTEIARYNPQLVVVGRHETERGEIPHAPPGSLGLRMAYHTPVDVLVIP